MKYQHLEALVDLLESTGLEKEDIVVEVDEYSGVADLDFTEDAHDKFCKDPESLRATLEVFCNYRKIVQFLLDFQFNY